MFKLLTRIFIKNSEDTGNPKVRQAYATLASMYGIFLNVVLFAAKYIAGTISGSVAIIADAFNNLSDAGSSVITFIGFLLSGKKPDKKHPYGYGRIEYVTGFVISAIILVVGAELGISSIKKIISPEPVEVSLIPVIIMGAAILVKFYMFLYNRSCGNKINSEALKATGTDCLTDCIATFVTLISMGISYFFGLNVDGIAGLLVSLFVLYAGITSAIDTISPLLGQKPEGDLVKEIEELILSHKEVHSIHDLMIHDYGPGNLIITVHCEVDGRDDIFELHDVMDNIEVEMNAKFGSITTVHMDPIDLGNGEIPILKEKCLEIVRSIYPESSIHDFRLVPGPTHTNILFDAVLQITEKDTDEEANKKITAKINSSFENSFAIIQIDRNYV